MFSSSLNCNLNIQSRNMCQYSQLVPMYLVSLTATIYDYTYLTFFERIYEILENYRREHIPTKERISLSNFPSSWKRRAHLNFWQPASFIWTNLWMMLSPPLIYIEPLVNLFHYSSLLNSSITMLHCINSISYPSPTTIP